MALELIGTIVFIWIMEEAIYWAYIDGLKSNKQYLLCKGISFRTPDYYKEIAKLENKQRVYRNIQKCIRMLIAIVFIFAIVIQLLVVIKF